MIPTTEQKKLINKALWGHNYTMEQFNNGEYQSDDRIGTVVFQDQYETKGSFASLSFFNLFATLSTLHKKAEAEGSAVLDNGVLLKVTTPPEHKSIYPTEPKTLFSLDIHTDGGLENAPSYRIECEVDASNPEKIDYSADLYRIDPNKPEDEFPTHLGHGSFIELRKKGEKVRILFREAGRSIVFSEFTAVMDLLRPSLEGHELRTESANIGTMQNFGALEVLHADGGLPGPLTLHTLDHMRTQLSEKVLPWLAEKSDKVYAALKDRGMVWGKKMFRYNDDDNVFVVPTSNPSQQAHFHENVSICSDYSAHIILTRKNEAGQNTDIKIYPVHRYLDFLPNIVDAIENSASAVSPMIHFDLTTNSFVHYSDECPDLLELALFSNNCDLEIINEGGIDKKENSSTNFDRYYEKPEDDMDDDEDFDEDNTPAIKM